MSKFRIEQDGMGELAVPINSLYGAQTQRAINNFPISHQPLPLIFIRALLKIKRSAALANASLDAISEDIATAIIHSVDALLKDEHLMQHFPVDVFQTGSGTSTNMNANEVLANLASKKLGYEVNANDHVNCSQSSNDTIPTAIHLSAALLLENELIPALVHLQTVIEQKAAALSDYVKTGRTHLMDAMPIRMDQSLMSWAAQLELNINHLRNVQSSLQKVAQGGTAIGTGVNALAEFSQRFCKELTHLTGLTFEPADNQFALIASQDTAVALSGLLKATAVSIMKISNDLRWMNSGPLSGLGEIELPALQPGSSIMPGKVNPVIPEASAMVAAQVIGNDAAITVAGQSGNFELNVMLPLVARNLCESLSLLANSSRLLADKAIAGFTVQEDNLTKALTRNPILVTALNPIIGYKQAAAIAKQAYAEKRPIIEVALENTDLSREELEGLLDPKGLTGK